jgi:pimeloyl-ACP methyl ester carboxylesterase
VPELAKACTVLLPYLPGSGHSRLPDGPFEVAVPAEQIADVATRTGHDRFAIAGLPSRSGWRRPSRGGDAPTLVIAGEADNFVDLAHSVEPAGRIATAVLPRLPGGHGVPHEYTTAVCAGDHRTAGRSFVK